MGSSDEFFSRLSADEPEPGSSETYVSPYNEALEADSCYFCSGTDLETHHIVPQRKNGSDRRENLVVVCKSCHQKLEQLYDKRFFERLGLTDNRGEERTHFACVRGDCSKRATINMKLEKSDTYDWFCEYHTMEIFRPGGEKDDPISETDIRKVVGDRTPSEVLRRIRKVVWEFTEEKYRLTSKERSIENVKAGWLNR